MLLQLVVEATAVLVEIPEMQVLRAQQVQLVLAELLVPVQARAVQVNPAAPPLTFGLICSVLAVQLAQLALAVMQVLVLLREDQDNRVLPDNQAVQVLQVLQVL